MRAGIAFAAAVVLAVFVFSGSAPASGVIPVVALPGYDSLDPAEAFQTNSWQVEYSTCLKLTNYSDDPAPAGSGLVLDAATAMSVSGDGLTYTFTIGSGLGFSDGSGDADAASFKRALQRVASQNSPGFAYIKGIAGATAGSGTISGVGATGQALTITLTARDAAFPAKMAMPFFCAVPSSTALTASTLVPIPTAGPYYIDPASVSLGPLQFHLLRNPHYGGDRPAVLDQINVTVNTDTAATYAAATAGSPTVDFTSVGTADRAAANTAYGPASSAAAAGHQQYYTPSANGVQYIVFNTSHITDKRVRRAIATVMNRTQLAGDLGVTVTDDLVSSSVQGYQDEDLYDLGGDLTSAQALMTAAGYGPGTHLPLKLYTRSGPSQVALGNHLKTAMESIYIDVTYDHSLSTGYFPFLGNPASDWDVGQFGWLPDYADQDAVLRALLDGRQMTPTSVGNDYAQWNDPATNGELDYANELSGDPRDASLAHLARTLGQDQAPLAAFGEVGRFELVSKRVSCVVYQPVYGLDLGRLCDANPVAADGTYSTAPPTADDPVSVAVTVPVDGYVSVVTATEPTELDGYNVLGTQLLIEAPDGTAADPLKIVLTLDHDALTAAGLTAATVPVLRNGAAIPACSGAAGTASPDPCVSNRTTDGSSNAVISIYTSHASLWGFGVADSTAPNLTTYGLNPGVMSESRTTTVTATSSSLDAAAAEFYVNVDDGAGENIPLGGTSTPFASAPYGNLLPIGSYTVGVRVRDAAGNWSSAGTVPLQVVDMTVLTQHPDTVAKGDPTFTFTTPESGATFECSLDGAAFTACTSPRTYPKLPKGSHVFRVRATKGGVPDPTPATFSWTNGSVPKVTIAKPAALTNDPDVTITFTSSDAGATFECNRDGLGFAPCSSPKTYLGLGDGAHAVQVRATDAAGRTGKASSVTFTVDTMPPTTDITKHPTDPTTSTSAAFSLLAPGEKKPTFECKLDGGSFGPCKKSVKVKDLLPGPHTFQARATDPAGNTGSAATFTWTIN